MKWVCIVMMGATIVVLTDFLGLSVVPEASLTAAYAVNYAMLGAVPFFIVFERYEPRRRRKSANGKP